jgi:hypothetical protein
VSKIDLGLRRVEALALAAELGARIIDRHGVTIAYVQHDVDFADFLVRFYNRAKEVGVLESKAAAAPAARGLDCD